MKLKEALEIGKDCDLDTVSEAILNIRLHAINIFAYGKEQSEYNELIEDFLQSEFDLEDNIEDCLKKL